MDCSPFSDDDLALSELLTCSPFQTPGKVGEVTKVDEDGDVMVSFGQRGYLFSPPCCLPAPPGSSVDGLGERGAGHGLGNNDLESFLGHGASGQYPYPARQSSLPFGLSVQRSAVFCPFGLPVQLRQCSVALVCLYSVCQCSFSLVWRLYSVCQCSFSLVWRLYSVCQCSVALVCLYSARQCSLPLVCLYSYVSVLSLWSVCTACVSVLSLWSVCTACVSVLSLWSVCTALGSVLSLWSVCTALGSVLSLETREGRPEIYYVSPPGI